MLQIDNLALARGNALLCNGGSNTNHLCLKGERSHPLFLDIALAQIHRGSPPRWKRATQALQEGQFLSRRRPGLTIALRREANCRLCRHDQAMAAADRIGLASSPLAREARTRDLAFTATHGTRLDQQRQLRTFCSLPVAPTRQFQGERCESCHQLCSAWRCSVVPVHWYPFPKQSPAGQMVRIFEQQTKRGIRGSKLQ